MTNIQTIEPPAFRGPGDSSPATSERCTLWVFAIEGTEDSSSERVKENVKRLPGVAAMSVACRAGVLGLIAVESLQGAVIAGAVAAASARVVDNFSRALDRCPSGINPGDPERPAITPAPPGSSR